jgi:hypothetical protein
MTNKSEKNEMKSKMLMAVMIGMLMLSGCQKRESPEDAKVNEINKTAEKGETIVMEPGTLNNYNFVRYLDKEAGVVCYKYAFNSISCVPMNVTSLPNTTK